LLSKSNSEKTKTQSGHVPTVTTVKGIQTTFVDKLFVSGVLVPRTDAVANALIPGLQITEVLSKEGDKVEVGQVLAKLDRSQFDVQLKQNNAAIRQTYAKISQTISSIHQLKLRIVQLEADLDRVQRLGSGVVSQANIDKQTTNLQITKAKLKVARAAHKAAEANKDATLAAHSGLLLNIKNTDIVAPAGGTISHCTAKVGAISGNQREALFRIIVDSEINLLAKVDADKIVQLKPDMKAFLQIPGLSKPIAARIISTSQAIDRLSHMGTVSIALPTNIDNARVGLFVSGFIIVQERSGLGVPVKSVRIDETGDAIVQIVKNGTIEIRKVITGLIDNGYVEVQGLNKNEIIVLKATPFLQENDTVREKRITLEDTQGIPGEQT